MFRLPFIRHHKHSASRQASAWRDLSAQTRYSGAMSAAPESLNPLLRQIAAFGGVGLVAMVCHYGALIALVEIFRIAPVPATLAGYVAGGLASYGLNRRHTFASDTPHAQAGPRFVLVAAVGFGITWALMHLLTQTLAAPYLPAQLLTTLIVMVWSYGAHRFFTFGKP
jgi:putative flippase GtrA